MLARGYRLALAEEVAPPIAEGSAVLVLVLVRLRVLRRGLGIAILVVVAVWRAIEVAEGYRLARVVAAVIRVGGGHWSVRCSRVVFNFSHLAQLFSFPRC